LSALQSCIERVSVLQVRSMYARVLVGSGAAVEAAGAAAEAAAAP
jgi:hypothetical protein